MTPSLQNATLSFLCHLDKICARSCSRGFWCLCCWTLHRFCFPTLSHSDIITLIISLCWSLSDRLSSHTSLSFSFKTTLFLLAVPHRQSFKQCMGGSFYYICKRSLDTLLTFVYTQPPYSHQIIQRQWSLPHWPRDLKQTKVVIFYYLNITFDPHSAAWRKLTDVTDLVSTVRQEIRPPTTPPWNLLHPPTTTSSYICVSQ